MNLFNQLSLQASQHLDSPAIVELGAAPKQVSFQQFLAGSHAYASQLKALGIGSGDKVIVMQPMSIELYWLLAALFKLEAIAVFIDPGQGLTFIEQCAGRIDAKALIGSNKILYASLLKPNLRAIKTKRALTSCFAFKQLTVNLADEPLAAVPASSPELNNEDKPALMTFTSGSTGQPKVIERSQKFLLDQYHILKSELNLQAGQKDITTLPIFLLANLMAGVTSYLVSDKLAKPSQLNANEVARRINQIKADRVGSNPAFFNALQGHKLTTIKQAYVGGAPVTPLLLGNMQQLLPNASITAIYGSSEAEPIASYRLLPGSNVGQQPNLQPKRHQSLLAGTPCPAVKVCIANPQQLVPSMSFQQWQAAELTTGQIGEILVSGPHVVQGYWQGLSGNESDSVSQNKVHVAGTVWHRTGDCGYFEQGDTKQLFLLGRLSARIPYQGSYLYPFSIEMAVQTKFSMEAALVQNRQGQVVLAYSKAITGEIEQKICQEFPAIDKLHKVPKLPKDKRHQSKIDYGELRELVD